MAVHRARARARGAQRPDPRNFHFILIFHQPKGCFPPDRQKVQKFTL
jgi:hypothetical protein